MNIDKDGKIRQRSKKWYSLSETLEIYAAGGQVILTLVTKDEYGKKVEIRPSLS